MAELLAEGLSQNAIAKRLGKAKSTIAYHARTAGRPVDERCNRRYDWEEIQRYYDEGHSIAECQERFGFARETWNAARRRGAVVARPHAMPIEELLSRNSRSRSHIKSRLIKAGIKEARCESCGLTEWRGKPISLQLHHINGDGTDNRLVNLQVTCPNCHAQTETWGGKNKGRRNGAGRAAEDPV